MQPVLLTKLSPPRIGKTIIDRPRLLKLLSDVTERKLTLLIAPAGYGKTVLALQLAKAGNQPLLWYHLDSLDNDPAVFLQYLIAGIGRRIPDFCQEALRVVAQGNIETRLRLLTAVFVNLLIPHSNLDFIIVFDDFHEITEPVIHKFVAEFLKYLPDNIHIIITSRSAPPFELSQLKLSDEVLTIDADQLSFTRPEIAEFLSQRGLEADEGLIQQLEIQTTGWPAALTLSNPIDGNSRPAKNKTAIYNYLAAEVFERQPESVRSFLLATSVLKEISPGFCDQLLERNDSRQILEYLEKQQLLVPLDNEESKFCYHQLFQSFLLDRLGSGRQPILLKAANLLRQANQLDQAIEYLIQAGSGESEALAEMIREVSGLELQRLRWHTVSRWLNSLGPETINKNPWLCYYQAQIELYKWRFEPAGKWLDQAAANFEALRDKRGLLETNFVRSKVFRMQSKYSLSLDLLHQVETQIPPAELTERYDIFTEKILSNALSGRLQETEDLINKALPMAKISNDPHITAILLGIMGTVSFLRGDYPKALQIYKRGAELVKGPTLPGYFSQETTPIIYQDWGELDKALEFAKLAVELKETYELCETLPSAYFQLAGVYLEREEYRLAEEYYQKAIMMVKIGQNEHFALALNLSDLARCLSLQQRNSEALMLAEEALEEAELDSGLAQLYCGGVCAPIFVKSGMIEKGESILKQTIPALEQMGYRKSLCVAYATMSWINILKEQHEAAESYLIKSLQIASRMNLIQPFISGYYYWETILHLALKKGIETTFIQRILSRLGKRALPLMQNLADDADVSVRLRVLLPLSEILDPIAQKIFQSLLDDPEPEVRRAAAIIWGKNPRNEGLSETGPQFTSPLHLSLLGPFRVYLNGREISAENWRSIKARDFLAYLAHHAGPVSVERILEDMWPGVDREKAMVNLHSTVYRLRKKLNGNPNQDFILYGGQRYQLAPEYYSTDREVFLKMLAITLKTATSAETINLLEDIVALYQGEYLADLDYEWIIPEREHLNNLYYEAREKLACFLLERGEYAKAIRHLFVLLDINPLSEKCYGLIMTAYAGLNDKQRVKEYYQKLQKTLREELGIDPSSETCDLFNKLYKTD
ncbi:MAG: BTAD domain-containing putative transcriptional regulator [Bacteroidota bacterium]